VLPSCKAAGILRVAVCCSVLQFVAVCCSVLNVCSQCAVVSCRVMQCAERVTCHATPVRSGGVVTCCSVLQCVAVCCSVLTVLQCADSVNRVLTVC